MRTGRCYIEMVTNYIFDIVSCSTKKSCKLCTWCGAQNKQEQFLKSPIPGSDAKNLRGIVFATMDGPKHAISMSEEILGGSV